MEFKLVCTIASAGYAKGDVVLDPALIQKLLAGDVARRFQRVALDDNDRAALAAMADHAALSVLQPSAE